jgi:hypothetical protein
MSMKCILRYSPNKARKAWIWINAAILACSVLLLSELLLTFSPEDRLEGTRAYLMYNFGTTFIWSIEVGLLVLDYHELQERSREDPDPQHHNLYSLIVELIIALYFFYDSTQVYKQWRNPNADDVEANVLSTIINAATYLYEVIRLSSRRAADDYVDITSQEAHVVSEVVYNGEIPMPMT